jgi:hypothetical protein
MSVPPVSDMFNVLPFLARISANTIILQRLLIGFQCDLNFTTKNIIISFLAAISSRVTAIVL